MARQSIIFISGNKEKHREFRQILGKMGIGVVCRDVDIDEIQDPDEEAVASRKARDAFAIIQAPVVVEDTGLHISAMNGYPGNLVKHFFASLGAEGIIRFLRGKNRDAQAVTAIAYCDQDGPRVFRGELRGSISERVRGESGFHWDFVFIPEGCNETFAEMGSAAKNRISQRRKALEMFAAWFRSRGPLQQGGSALKS